MKTLRKKARLVLGALLVLGVAVACATARTVTPPPAPEEEGRLRGYVTLEGEEIEFQRELRPVWEDTALVVYVGETEAVNRTIPAEEVEGLIYRKIGVGRSILLGAFLASAFLVAVAGASSCPILYAYDGARWAAAGEPLGGAVTLGLARTDLTEMEGLATADGEYRILIMNEMDETQHLDAFSLVVADHAEGTRAVAEPLTGRILEVGRTLSPAAAWTTTGEDLTDPLSEADGRAWSHPLQGPGLPPDGRLRDTVVVEFPRPASDSAVLVARARTTAQGAWALKGMLELWGEEVDTWYDLLDHSAATRASHEDWVVREELWVLQVHVEEEDGWHPRAVIVGGGPAIAETQAVSLDLSGVSGDVVRLRLHPPRGYWELDRLALAPGAPVAASRMEIQASAAVDQTGQDVSTALSEVDGDELILDRVGDAVEARFPTPPVQEGRSRTVFARSHGFYRIHLDESGPRRAAVLDSLWIEPGFAVRLAARRAPSLAAELEAR